MANFRTNVLSESARVLNKLYERELSTSHIIFCEWVLSFCCRVQKLVYPERDSNLRLELSASNSDAVPTELSRQFDTEYRKIVMWHTSPLS